MLVRFRQWRPFAGDAAEPAKSATSADSMAASATTIDPVSTSDPHPDAHPPANDPPQPVPAAATPSAASADGDTPGVAASLTPEREVALPGGMAMLDMRVYIAANLLSSASDEDGGEEGGKGGKGCVRVSLAKPFKWQLRTEGTLADINWDVPIFDDACTVKKVRE